MAQLDSLAAVVFDFDGTLVHTDINFAEMRRRIVEHLRASDLHEPGGEDSRYVLEIIAGAEQRLQDQPERQQRYQEEARQILRDVELPSCQSAAPFAGVPESLGRLRTAGLKIGIITRNSHDGVRAVLSRYPLPYDALLTRDDLRNVKPHKEHLKRVLAELAVPPEQALMVGDHPTDIQCGQAAGVRTCGLLTAKTTLQEFHDLGADFAFRDVPSLVEFILDHKLP